MRTAYHSKFHTVDAANGPCKIGVFTGADFCSEHEWGIKKLRASLGMRDDVIGVAARRPTNGVTNVHLEVDSTNSDWMAYLLIGDAVRRGRSYDDGKFMPANEWFKKHDYFTAEDNNEQLHCEWDDGSIRVAVKGKENVALLANLYDYFKTNDVFVGLGGGGIFSNGGINIMGLPDMPKETQQMIEDVDTDALKLDKAAKDTGIEAKLKATQIEGYDYPKSGCKWFALAPRWVNTTNHTEKARTKHPVVFWLNPYDQQRVNFGWFTVEELELWIKGEGPIPKQQKN